MEKKNVSRRGFLKGTGAFGIAAALTLSGCGTTQNTKTGTGEESGSGLDGKYSWETAPDPIPENELAETVETDIVVIGAGMAGCVAALTAAQEGMGVICLQKHSAVLTNGGGFAAYNSKVAQESGVEIDVDEMFETWQTWAENRVDRKMFNVWVDHSGEACDWLLDSIEGSKASLQFPPAPVDPEKIAAEPFRSKEEYPVAHMVGKTQTVIEVLQEKAQELGVDFRFSTPAVQLVRGEDNGSRRVHAVIAQNDAGEYIRINASKAVILCAGDYAGNAEMREKWLPHAADLQSPYMPPVNTGDGDLMAMWIGAAMDRGPHCSNIHYDHYLDDTNIAFAGGTPWLRVNKNGERFSNEDVPYQQIYAQDVNQPDHMHFQIFDDDYDTYWPNMGLQTFRGNGVCSPDAAAGAYLEILEKKGIDTTALQNNYEIVIRGGVAQGTILEAETVEELAAKMEVPSDKLAETIDRYNQMVEQSYDEDYGKNKDYLFPIKKSPFYAVPRRAMPLGVLNGITVNYDMQVLDNDGEVIPGLYAAGNNSGGNWFGGMVQPMCVPTLTIGRAVTTGRLAALVASEES